MLSKNYTLLSKTIIFLRFPLIIAVVFIHSNLNDMIINGTVLTCEKVFPIYDILSHIVNIEISSIAVPLFFFISGFLFFFQLDNYTTKDYIKKIKKRFRTLLIPYLFWNIVVLLFNLFAQSFMTSMLSGKNKLIIDYNVTDWLNIFWNHISNPGTPISPQFWFIRDLIIVVLFTPLIYYFIKYIKIYGIIFLGLLWTFDLWFDVIGFSIVSFFFFSFGAWFSINKRDFASDFYSLRLYTIFIFIALCVLNTIIWHNNIDNLYFIHNINIIIGIIAVVSWSSWGIEENKIRSNTFLAGSSFFVFAYHWLPIALFLKIYLKFTASYISDFTMIIGYLFTVTIQNWRID